MASRAEGQTGDRGSKTIDRLKLVLSSKKVLARVDVIEDSFMAWDGQTRVKRRRVGVYDYVLDEKQAMALDEARELAARRSLVLEVTDLSRQSGARRAARLASWKIRKGVRALGLGPNRA